jgi:hypothetical protein
MAWCLLELCIHYLSSMSVSLVDGGMSGYVFFAVFLFLSFFAYSPQSLLHTPFGFSLTPLAMLLPVLHCRFQRAILLDCLHRIRGYALDLDLLGYPFGFLYSMLPFYLIVLIIFSLGTKHNKISLLSNPLLLRVPHKCPALRP